MSVPSLKVQVNGQSQVSADQFNTYVQTCDTVVNLRGFIGVSGMEIQLQGFTSPGDGGQGPFYWNATGTGPDNGGVTNVVPSGAAIGCWTRIGSVAGQNSVIQTTASGTNSLTLSAISGQTVITAYANYQLFGFVAPATTSGAVSANVNLVGSLPVYRTDLVQAGANDLISGVYYIIAYNSALNSSTGGFQIISNTLNNLTFTGTTTSPNINLTGSTVPANGLYLAAANTLGISARSLPVLQFTNPASAVNYITLAGSASLSTPNISTAGSDTDIGLNFAAKGAGGYAFYTGTGTLLQFQILNVASAVNYLAVYGNTAASSPAIQAIGSDTNIGILMVPKGTANLQVGSTTSQGLVLGTGALATNATAGFLQIPSSAGAATGAVTAFYTGAVCIHYDSTNNKIMVRSGGTWRSTAALT